MTTARNGVTFFFKKPLLVETKLHGHKGVLVGTEVLLFVQQPTTLFHNLLFLDTANACEYLSLHISPKDQTKSR